jgi:SAM-dependent methyltransferase
MNFHTPKFDHFSSTYRDLLRDPIRDRFTTDGGNFFHLRKRDLIRDYFGRQHVDTHEMNYLDLGCGQGELMTSMRDDFAYVAGCDPSSGMLKSGGLNGCGVETRLQEDPGTIPFPSATFDFVTAVCVYHHVPPTARPTLTAEVARVLRPNGTFAIIEHNPYNPVTQIIVHRAPIDADAILLLEEQKFSISEQRYFLYFPEAMYRHAQTVEALLHAVPLGGQYAVFGRIRKGEAAEEALKF